MENNLQIFTNEEFGDVRVVMIDGEPWFVATDVCNALGIDRTQTRRLDDDEKGICNVPTLGGKQSMLIVNEPGLYRLIFSSRKAEAKKFQRWVYHEVLPTIRKNVNEKWLQFFIDKLVESAKTAELQTKCVYVLKMSNNTVKIGVTGNFRQRARAVETGSGLTIIDWYHTAYFPLEQAYAIEAACHRIFEHCRIQGEFFSVDFNEACTAVDNFFAKAVHAFSSVMKFERPAAIDF